jgi:hypothetical protein
MASKYVYFAGGMPVGHAFIQIPAKHINNIDFNINSKEEVSNLINKTIFDLAETAKMTPRLIHAEENIITFCRSSPMSLSSFWKRFFLMPDGKAWQGARSTSCRTNMKSQ